MRDALGDPETRNLYGPTKSQVALATCSMDLGVLTIKVLLSRFHNLLNLLSRSVDHWPIEGERGTGSVITFAGMIAPGSLLDRIPQEVERRQILNLEAIVLSLQLIETDYRSIESRLTGRDPEEEDITTILGAAWGIVDASHRLRLLVGALPGLTHNPPYESFMRALRPVENLRHGLQHLDERIASLAAENSPVWGYLTWLEPIPENKILSRLMVPGSIAEGMSLSVINPIGKEIHAPFDHLHLNAFEQELNLSALRRSCQTFVSRLERAARVAFEALQEGETSRIRLELEAT